MRRTSIEREPFADVRVSRAQPATAPAREASLRTAQSLGFEQLGGSPRATAAFLFELSTSRHTPGPSIESSEQTAFSRIVWTGT